MIQDFENSAPSPLSRGRGWMLSLASAAVAAAALLVVTSLPHVPARSIAPTRPSVLGQARLSQAQPRLLLVLPAALALALPPTWTDAGSGPSRALNAPRIYRLRGTNDVVSIAPVPDAPPIVAPSPRPAGGLAVHGQYAQGWTYEPTSLSVVRWTENGVTYEIASRTLPPIELARVAEQIR